MNEIQNPSSPISAALLLLEETAATAAPTQLLRHLLDAMVPQNILDRAVDPFWLALYKRVDSTVADWVLQSWFVARISAWGRRHEATLLALPAR